jgi:hypothetical protein
MVSTACYCQVCFTILTVKQENNDAPVYDPTGAEDAFVSVYSH